MGDPPWEIPHGGSPMGDPPIAQGKKSRTFIKDWILIQSPRFNSLFPRARLWLGFFFKHAEINWGRGRGDVFYKPEVVIIYIYIYILCMP